MGIYEVFAHLVLVLLIDIYLYLKICRLRAANSPDAVYVLSPFTIMQINQFDKPDPKSLLTKRMRSNAIAIYSRCTCHQTRLRLYFPIEDIELP